MKKGTIRLLLAFSFLLLLAACSTNESGKNVSSAGNNHPNKTINEQDNAQQTNTDHKRQPSSDANEQNKQEGQAANHSQKEKGESGAKQQDTTEQTPSSDDNSQQADIDKPLLKETVKVTQEGKHIITNPASLLVCANKHRTLPSDYVPDHLVVPDIPFPYSHPEDYTKAHLRKIAAKHIDQLFAAAKKAGVQLYGISGYRSYDRQDVIFSQNVEEAGSVQKANQFSAKPGQSEHQTGLSMDVSTAKMNFRLLQSFGDTRAGQWLAAHSAEYGFILRYPKGQKDITGYEYEPWHLRYVGKKHAQKIAKKDITLEEYLGYPVTYSQTSK